MCQGIAQFNLSNLERIFLSLHHDGHRETSLPAFLARGGAIAILAAPPAHPGHRPAPNGLRPRKRHHLLPKRKLPPQADLRGNGVHCAVLSVLLGATRIASEEERRLRLSAECAFMIPSRRALSIKMPVSINKRLSL